MASLVLQNSTWSMLYLMCSQLLPISRVSFRVSFYLQSLLLKQLICFIQARWLALDKDVSPQVDVVRWWQN